MYFCSLGEVDIESEKKAGQAKFAEQSSEQDKEHDANLGEHREEPVTPAVTAAASTDTAATKLVDTGVCHEDTTEPEKKQDAEQEDSIADPKDVVIDTTALRSTPAEEQKPRLEEKEAKKDEDASEEKKEGPPAEEQQHEGGHDDEKDLAARMANEEGDVEDEGIGLEGEEIDEERDEEMLGGRTVENVIPAEREPKEGTGLFLFIYLFVYNIIFVSLINKVYSFARTFFFKF